MAKIDCTKCSHCISSPIEDDCKLSFRWAAGGGGQAVDNTRDVFFCRDYEEVDDDEEE